LTAARIRYGYRRLHILLRCEDWAVNHMRTYRICRDEGLSIRSKLPKRTQAWRYRQGRPAIGGPNEVWAMNFVSDHVFDGRPFQSRPSSIATRERHSHSHREPTSAPSR
jgi:putative transposase